jgi:excisionase family DNA binding protein
VKEFLNMRQTADLLGVHPVTINRYCKDGKLTYYQVGSRKRFLKQDIENFIKGAVRHAADTSKNPFDAS